MQGICVERRGSHRRDVILRLRWSSSQYLDDWMLKNIVLVNRWRKKMSICGNCYFILTLSGVCHETVNFFPFKRRRLQHQLTFCCKIKHNLLNITLPQHSNLLPPKLQEHAQATIFPFKQALRLNENAALGPRRIKMADTIEIGRYRCQSLSFF